MKTLIPAGIRASFVLLVMVALVAFAILSTALSVQAKPIGDTPEPPSQNLIATTNIAVPVTGFQSGYLDAGASAVWNNTAASFTFMNVMDSFDVGAGAPWISPSQSTARPDPTNRQAVPVDQWIQGRMSGGGR